MVGVPLFLQALARSSGSIIEYVGGSQYVLEGYPSVYQSQWTLRASKRGNSAYCFASDKQSLRWRDVSEVRSKRDRFDLYYFNCPVPY